MRSRYNFAGGDRGKYYKRYRQGVSVHVLDSKGRRIMRDDVIFIDIDTQHDFMDEEGALAVPGARAIRSNLERLTEVACERGVRILASEDAHAADDPEFEEFGRHCVKGSPGAVKIDETRVEGALRVPSSGEIDGGVEAALAAPQVVVEKQVLDAFSNPAVDEMLRALPEARVVLYGVATEYCVGSAARSLRERGRDVTLVTDAVKGITEEAAEKTLAELRGLGVETATTDEVLARL
jgi:nicotinamidase/pyrazinamidase